MLSMPCRSQAGHPGDLLGLLPPYWVGVVKNPSPFVVGCRNQPAAHEAEAGKGRRQYR